MYWLYIVIIYCVKSMFTEKNVSSKFYMVIKQKSQLFYIFYKYLYILW